MLLANNAPFTLNPAIGPQNGTGSALHVDGFASHFWMLLTIGWFSSEAGAILSHAPIPGSKHWIAYHQDDTALLYPNAFTNKLAFDAMKPDLHKFPLSQHAGRYDFILQV